jgi:cytochrome P450
LRFPDEMTALRQNPDLVKTAVEEFLRFDPPVHVAPDRWAKEDITIAGVTIRKGEMMNVGIGAANHDAAQFEDPHLLNIRRPNNRHLAFGQGTHYCLGAPLARVEANYAFNALLECFPNLQLRQPSEALPWRTNPFFRSLKTLHLKL